MIDILYAIIMLAICILGMLGAFFLGTRKFQERVFESSEKPRMLEDSDIYNDASGNNVHADRVLNVLMSRTIYKSGLSSIYHTRTWNGYFGVTDTALPTGFPMKSGESNTVFTLPLCHNLLSKERVLERYPLIF